MKSQQPGDAVEHLDAEKGRYSPNMKPLLREDITSLMAITIGTVAASGLTATLLLREPVARDTVIMRQVETIPAVVTARDLPVGATITAADVKVVDWPAEAPPPLGYASFPEQVIGLIVAQPISEHETLRPPMLTGVEISRESRVLLRTPRPPTDAVP